MKYSCSKDPSFASVGKHGVLREFTFFDKVRFIKKMEMYVSGSKSAIAIGFITQSRPLNNFIYFLGSPSAQESGGVREFLTLYSSVQSGSGFRGRTPAACDSILGVRKI